MTMCKLPSNLKNEINRGKELYNNKNVTFIGGGAFRNAYAFGKNKECIVKVAHPIENGFGESREGIFHSYGFSKNTNKRHNLTEAKLWRNLPDDIKRKYFVPVDEYDKDGKWLVMPRIQNIELSENIRAGIGNHLVRELIKKNMFCYDLHTGNIGTDYNNNPKILDYGMGCDSFKSKDELFLHLRQLKY